VLDLTLGSLAVSFTDAECQRTARSFSDGPGGTQVPQRVIDAISDYLATNNANSGGVTTPAATPTA